MAWTKPHRDPATGRMVLGQLVQAQKYRRYAALNDAEYREMMETCTGCRSSKDKSLTCHDFEVFMAHVETVLWARVDELVVPKPPDTIERFYYRNKLPKNGEPNSRLIDKLWKMWGLLQPNLPEADRNAKYLAEIATQASGCYVKDIWQAKAWQVSLTIEALKSRLAQALTKAVPTTVIPPLGVPASSGLPPFAPSVSQPSTFNPQPACSGACSCLPSMTDVPF